MKNKLNILLVLIMLSGVGLACKFSEAQSGERKLEAEKTEKKPEIERIDRYTIRGFEFVYYKIPVGLSREKLIETAQKLHEEEPKAQLILIDDDSKAQDYINYAKAVSAGDYETPLPKDWADKHVVANVQKMMSGKFVLYEGYGYKEIAELK